MADEREASSNGTGPPHHLRQDQRDSERRRSRRARCGVRSQQTDACRPRGLGPSGNSSLFVAIATFRTNLVAAKSGTKRKLRPRQTGTTPRRLVGAALVAHDSETLSVTGRQAQFSRAGPEGLQVMRHSTQALMESRLDVVWHQLDCPSAFGELSLTSCLQALQQHIPHLLAFEAQWLTQSTRAVAQNDVCKVTDFIHGRWIGPLRLVFASDVCGHLAGGTVPQEILEAILAEQISQPTTACSSFLSGLTLVVRVPAAKHAGGRQDKWRGHVGLRFNLATCKVSTPTNEMLAGIEYPWEQTRRHCVLPIAGRPYSVMYQTIHHIDSGEQSFLSDFCQQHL